MPRLLTSAQAARLLGVGVTTVKRWSDNGWLPSVTTRGGHRRFEAVEVERARAATRGAAPADPWQEWMDVLARGGDVHAVLALLFAERARRAAWHEVAAHVGALVAEIGARWARGEMTVAQEHVASAALQRGLALAAETMPLAASAPRCLLAPAEGDEHMLGLSLAELCLRERGWRAEWLGGRTRSLDVVERVRAGGVQMVGISASAVMQDRRALRAAVKTVGSACQRAGVDLVLGGAGGWPDPPPFGVRLRRWDEFHAYLGESPPPSGSSRMKPRLTSAPSGPR